MGTGSRDTRFDADSLWDVCAMGVSVMKFRWWLICSAVAMPLCFYMSRSDWPLLPLLIGGVLLWPEAKYRILLLTGLLSFFMRLSFSIAVPDVLLTGPLPMIPVLWSIAITALVVTEGILLTMAVSFLARRASARGVAYVVGAFVVLVGLCLIGVGYMGEMASVRLIAWPLRVLVWLSPCALLTLATFPRGERSFWARLASVCQGWTMGIKHPFGALARWESREATVVDEVIRIQRKGIKLLLTTAALVLLKRAVFLTFLVDEMERTVPPIAELLVLLRDGTSPSFFYLWGYVLLDWFDFFFRAWVWGAMAIGIMRLSGFDLYRHTWRPFEATTIFDFFQRSLFYFNDVIFGVIFWPVFTSLRFKNQRLRIFISLFLSVGLFNALLTTGYEWFRGSLNRPAELILKNSTGFVCYLTYAGLLALALYPSILERLVGKEKVRMPSGMRLVRIGMFVMFWSAIRVFERSLPGEYFLNWRLFTALFGLSV